MQIDGKRIVLTGAASGIGRALLNKLAYYDAEIIAADLNADRLGDAVRSPEGARASLNPFVCNLAEQAGTDELFAHALATMGGIDIFIANAGFAYYERIGSADWAHIETIYNVNTFSPIYSTLKMAEINPDNPYLTVITASTMAHWGLAGYSLYASTKAALHRFAEAYRQEMPANGRLCLVYPIATKTRFFDQTSAPVLPPTQSAEDVAAAVVRGMERDTDSVLPSVLWRVARALNHVIPVVKPQALARYAQALDKWEQDTAR